MPGQRVPPAYQWKPTDVVAHVRGAHGARVGTVIDLTMSRRYYKPNEFRDLGIQHIKIPCRGHGQVPEPRHVNQFVWEVRKAQKLAQDVWEKVRAAPIYQARHSTPFQPLRSTHAASEHLENSTFHQDSEAFPGSRHPHRSVGALCVCRRAPR